MKRYHYYKGIFESQFRTVGRDQIAPHRTWAKVEPLPRFILSKPEQITEAEFNEINDHARGPHIHISKPDELELRFSGRSAVRTTFEEIVIFNRSHEGKTPEEIREHEIAAEGLPDLFQFIAKKDKEDHGRLIGYAWCKTYAWIDEVKKPGPINNTPTLIEPDTITPASITTTPIIQATTSANTINSRPGCMGSLLGMPAVGANGLPAGLGNRGCLGAMLPSASGGGCGRAGCGLISLLLGIGFLISMFRSCTTNPVPIPPPPVIIHDTVYIEKIKERVDTIRLLQVDTVKMIDSTRQVNYETVTLPNVNFFTKSDKLTPSSIPDIQQVAEYLNKHTELEAVVIGHTDNLGVSAENLELSARRAEAVRNMIVMMGVDASRITAVGKGDTAPKADNKTQEGRLMNRRVELQILNKQTSETKRTILPDNDE